jgi:HSP20 family protein
MALFRRDPFFDDFFTPYSFPSSLQNRHSSASSTPAHHVHETENAVQLSVDVPGVKSSDLKVEVEDNVLRVTGERKTAGSESRFVRSFAIDRESIDPSHVKANLDCGVLTLTVPKREKATPKTIAITENASEDKPTVETVVKDD